MTGQTRPADAFAHDWHADWIAPVEAGDLPARQRPVHQLAGGLHLDGAIAEAKLHITAHGIYEAFVNGTRVVSMRDDWSTVFPAPE